MNCPACKTEMVEKDFGGTKVDVCENGCKGIWFDWLELEKLDEKHEGLGKALDEALGSDRHKDDNRGQIACSKCNQLMVAHLYKASKMVTVDECYACGGFFLDSGELEVIRESFMDEKSREEYVAQLLAQEPAYLEFYNTLDEKKKSINPGAVKRAAAINKVVDIITSKFSA
ncbi:MAG: zf-TFIIB domain-containing protein [Candidatus Omnitrophica bacterium]|nr:zf-TFIIB domain-containing protein [Candidatus Omnitrophota bacterium]